MYILIVNFSISEGNAYEVQLVNFEKIKSSVKLWIIKFKIKRVIGGVNVMESFLIHTDIQKSGFVNLKRLKVNSKHAQLKMIFNLDFHMKILSGW